MEFRPEKKLGFGLMRMPLNNPANAADVDIDEVCRMVDRFLEKGFTYFDTALMYNGFASEGVVKKALVKRHPRESFTVATKLHAGFFNSPEEREKVFGLQLKHTGAGWFDYYLLHGVDGGLIGKYEEFDCFSWLLEKKRAGLVKHAGFSFHGTPALLEEILNRHPEMEFVQLQINYLDWESEWVRSRECYETAVRHGKSVVVMEPVKGGTLANLPEEAEKLFREREPGMSPASWAIRFAASLPGVMAVLSGMSTMEQVEDNTATMEDFRPLDEEERALCFKAAQIINAQTAIPCTGCSYCTEGCPMHIAIPKYFSLYNEDMRENLAQKGWTVNFSNYAALTKDFGRAGDCVGCGQCEAVCPQHLPIIENLQKVSRHYDR